MQLIISVKSLIFLTGTLNRKRSEFIVDTGGTGQGCPASVANQDELHSILRVQSAIWALVLALKDFFRNKANIASSQTLRNPSSAPKGKYTTSPFLLIATPFYIFSHPASTKHVPTCSKVCLYMLLVAPVLSRQFSGNPGLISSRLPIHPLIFRNSNSPRADREIHLT